MARKKERRAQLETPVTGGVRWYSAAPDSRREFLVGAVTLLALILAAYSSSIPGGFLWDDDAYVVNNATLRSVDGLRRIWFEPRATPQYYPLVHTSFWIEYQLWELWAPGYRLVNVLVHAAASVLLWRVLRRLDVPLPWLIAAVFALHPVHVESVAWVTERKNTLSAFFILAFAWVFLPLVLDIQDRSRSPRTEPPEDAPSPRLATRSMTRNFVAQYIAAAALFIAALLSKTVVVTAPAALLVLVWWKRGRWQRRELLPVLPLFAIALPFGLLTAWLERDFVGAAGDEWDFSFADRWLIAGRALWFYAGKLLAPIDQSFIYPRWTIDDGQAWQYLFPLTAWAAIGLCWWRRQTWGRGPLAGVLYFAGTLFPALGFFNVYPMRYSFVADHFQYLASLGVLAMAVTGGERGLAWVARRYPEHVTHNMPRACAAIALVALAALTWNRGAVFRDLEILWRDNLLKNPDSVMVHANLGSLLRDQGRLDEARAEFQRAIELDPRQAPPYNLLGTILMATGDAAGAQRSFEQAIQLDSRYADAHSNLGIALDALGETTAAFAELQRAVELEPRNAICRYNWGSVLHKHDRLAEAAREYRAALAIDPLLVEAEHNLRALEGSYGP